MTFKGSDPGIPEIAKIVWIQCVGLSTSLPIRTVQVVIVSTLDSITVNY